MDSRRSRWRRSTSSSLLRFLLVLWFSSTVVGAFCVVLGGPKLDFEMALAVVEEG